MAMRNIMNSLLLMVASTMLVSGCFGSLVSVGINLEVKNFIEGSCNSTMYPKICVRTLSPVAGSMASLEMSELATVAVNVSLVSCVKTSRWFNNAGINATQLQLQKAAVEDCVQNFVDSKDQIEQSLYILQHLSADSFRLQMSDTQTYMSAALTNVDSCLDGVQGNNEVASRVQNFLRVTSNALALVNVCAASSGSYNSLHH